MADELQVGSLFDEFEARAKKQLDPMLYDYVAGGAEDESTLADNIAASSTSTPGTSMSPQN